MKNNDVTYMIIGCAYRVHNELGRGFLEREGVPGSVQAIETCGEYKDLNPHIHAVVTDGLYMPNGTFRYMPRYNEGAMIYLNGLWEKPNLRKNLIRSFQMRVLPMSSGNSRKPGLC